ncbi:MAG: four helix bundle protein [Gemmatimonadales bacterium]
MYQLERLNIWRAAVELSCEAYGFTLCGPITQHFDLRNQIRRSAASIPANIAEGYGLGTQPQMIRCLRISLGSAYELRTHLRLAAYHKLLIAEDLDAVRRCCDPTIRLITGTLKGLQRMPRG